MDRIIIEPEDGGESWTASGFTEEDGKFYLTDGELLEDVLDRVVPYAQQYNLTTAEVDLTGLPAW